MKTTKDILVEARDLIEKGWCQGDGARGATGKVVRPLDPDAVCFCAVGAIDRVCEGDDLLREEAWHRLRLGIFGDIRGPIVKWNDAPERTKPEVLAAFQKAIDSLGAE
jgi:hypothetical protein